MRSRVLALAGAFVVAGAITPRVRAAGAGAEPTPAGGENAGAAAASPASPAASPASPAPSPASSAAPAACLPSGDGYFRAHLAGALEARIDWHNSGLKCEGEPRDTPAGVRLSFKRDPGKTPDILFVFGLSGVREGKPAREVGTNVTVIVQGTDRIYGTLGDARCTVDSLAQHRLGQSREYRVEARGFCTQPAHAVRGDGAVLVSTFEFAGRVNYAVPEDETPPGPGK